MRNLPKLLAFAFIAVTLSRVALLISVGFKADWQGWAFAVGLAIGVYLSTYFIRYKETFWPAISATVFFVIVDLWFNEVEIVRTLSASDMIAPSANFLSMNAEYLRGMMQVSALIYGAFPTIAAALLGWLQAWAEKVATLKPRAFFPHIQLAIMAKVDSMFPVTTETRRISGNNQPLLPETVENAPYRQNAVRWENLTTADRAEIAGMLPMQIISRYGGSDRRARMWKQWAREGKL